ncbi:MAG: DUF362 domain-containing protein [Archaeoglobaceae archaeon]
MPKVAVVKDPNPLKATLKALELVEDEIYLDEKPVLVKPNYVVAKHPSTGMTTDAGVIEGVVRFLVERGKEVLIGEGSGWADTFEAFKLAGVDKVAEKYGARLIDLNKDEFVEVSPPNPLALRSVRVAKTALKCEIVSVPKLKAHRQTKVTLGLKNLMGALASKGSFHDGRLHENIADLASLLKPKLTVIDGIIAGEGHETRGVPRRMDVVIAGADVVAVDSVGAALMGVNPLEVEHIVLAARKGLGTCKIEEIEIVGDEVI